MSRLYPIKARKMKWGKYHSATCRCNQGHAPHGSRGEAGYCNQLEILRKAGEIENYETQKTFPLIVNGKTVCRHRVDFVVYTKAGPEVHEFKGGRITMTEVWNIKRKLFEALNPEIPYYVIRPGGGERW